MKKQTEISLRKISDFICVLALGFGLGVITCMFMENDSVRRHLDYRLDKMTDDLHKEIGENWMIDTMLYDCNGSLGWGGGGFSIVLDPNNDKFFLIRGDTLIAGQYDEGEGRNWWGLMNLYDSDNWRRLNIQP